MAKQKPKGWLDKYASNVAASDATRTSPALNYRSVEDSERIEREKELARRKTSVGPQGKPSFAIKQAAEERYAQDKRNEKYKNIAEYAQVIGGGLEVAAPFTGPLAPIVGGAGTLASAGSSAYLAGRDVAEENYGSALMNAGFGGLGIAGYTPAARATNIGAVNVAKAADAADYVSDVAGTYNAYDEYGRNYASKVQGISKDEIGDVVKSWLGTFKPRLETTNKNSLKVLEDFKQRIQTPEGQRRLKELGIPDDSFLQQIKIVDDPSTLGVYRPHSNTVGVNPDLPNSNFTNSVVRHEIEHGVQDALGIAKMNKYNYDASNFKYLFRPTAKKKALEDVNKLTTPIDDILSNVELRKTPEKVDWDEIKTNRGKQDPSKLFDYLSHKQNATNYFDSGSGGGEKSAFLGELQQYMLDNKYLNHPYETVTPDKVKDVFANAIFDEENKGKYLRLFNIMKPTDNNFQLLSEGLNKMLSAPTVIGAGAAAATLANQPEQKKNGGWLEKYNDGGPIQPNYNDSNASAGPGFEGDGTFNKGRNYSPAWGGQFAMGGSIPGTVGFTYARTIDPAPSEGKYAKKTMASAQNGQEMQFYQEGFDFKPKSISKKGSVIKDDMGQWNHPGEITEIGSNQITMQGVPYPVMGISDTGDTQMMYPNQEYQYDGNSVTEYPMMQDGGILDPIINLGKRAVNYIGGLFDDDEQPVVKAAPVKPKLDSYDTMLDLGYNSPQGKKLEKQLGIGSTEASAYQKDKNRIKLTTGRFANANVSSRLIDDIAEAAQRSGVPVKDLLTLVARESTFGEDKLNPRHDMGKDKYTSGWDVENDYKPYDPHRFLADKKVPGVYVTKSSHGYYYEIADEKAVREHLKKNPQLLEQYRQKVAATPDIGNKNFFDLSAEFLKKKGIKGYNPGDPNYEKMFKQDYATLKKDKALMDYLKKKKYPFENGGQLKKLDQLTNFTNYNPTQPSGWLEKYQ